MTADTDYDAIVVGAGIQGAAVAQALALSGRCVRLIEQYPHPAQGTSSRSSKLIHGGLRYLESGQISLVRQCLRERRLLLQNAPDLVKLQPFYIPVYKTTRRRPLQIRLGLTLYALLGGLRPENRFAKVPRPQWPQLDGLQTDGLQAVYRYMDGQTDDAALTAAVVASAKDHGATVSLSSRMTAATLDRDGVRVQIEHDSQTETRRARVLVNAAGPWVNRVLKMVQPAVECLPIDLVAGTHIVLPRRLDHGIFYVEAPADARAVFVMPWQNQTLVGTTETPYHGDPADVTPQDHEIDYLLETYNHYFPTRLAVRADVVASFAGLRVLPAGPGTAFARPRETRLHTDRQDHPRMLSIYGGKLTAYRAMAEKVVGLIVGERPPCGSGVVGGTKKLKLEHT